MEGGSDRALPLHCADVRAAIVHCQPMSLFQVYERAGQRATAALRAGGRGLLRAGLWLVPPRCLMCDGTDCDAGIDLCRQCASELPAAPDFQGSIQPLTAVFSPWRYEYPVDRLVRALKFHGDRSVARALGSTLGHWRAARPAPLPDLLVPVPLHGARQRERGYNQADEIARALAAVLSVQRLPLALERVRETAPQTSLPALYRRGNLAGAFRVPDALRCKLRRSRLALIDDVMTTGSTAQAAATALLEAQAESVELWTLARVL